MTSLITTKLEKKPKHLMPMMIFVENLHAQLCAPSFFLVFLFFFLILLYNTVLVLPYIDTNPPWVYTSSQSRISLPPPTPHHLSGSSPCISPKHPVSCIKHRLALRFLHDSIHVSILFLYSCCFSKTSQVKQLSN